MKQTQDAASTAACLSSFRNVVFVFLVFECCLAFGSSNKIPLFVSRRAGILSLNVSPSYTQFILSSFSHVCCFKIKAMYAVGQQATEARGWFGQTDLSALIRFVLIYTELLKRKTLLPKCCSFSLLEFFVWLVCCWIYLRNWSFFVEDIKNEWLFCIKSHCMP